MGLEFKGIKEEMLDEYANYELQVSNREYDKNRNIIFELMDIALEITKIDQLEFKDKDLITSSLNEFITSRAILNDLVGKRIINLASLVRETYNVEKKLFELNDSYFKLEKTKLLGEDRLFYVHLWIT